MSNKNRKIETLADMELDEDELLRLLDLISAEILVSRSLMHEAFMQQIEHKLNAQLMEIQG